MPSPNNNAMPSPNNNAMNNPMPAPNNNAVAVAKKPCNLLDKQYTNKLNNVWDTCITVNGIQHNILYITPKNVITESAQIPEFTVILPPNENPIPCKIMIEDKYVGYFLNINDKWYAIMRTINTGFFAKTEINKAYYLVSNISINIQYNGDGNGAIILPPNSYENVNNTTVLSTSNAKTIRLQNMHFKNITKEVDSNIFNVLEIFRNQKIMANVEKVGFGQGFFNLFA